MPEAQRHRSRNSGLEKGTQLFFFCGSFRDCSDTDDNILFLCQVYSLFVDVNRSTRFLMDYQASFMFSEVKDDFHWFVVSHRPSVIKAMGYL